MVWIVIQKAQSSLRSRLREIEMVLACHAGHVTQKPGPTNISRIRKVNNCLDYTGGVAIQEYYKDTRELQLN